MFKFEVFLETPDSKVAYALYDYMLEWAQALNLKLGGIISLATAEELESEDVPEAE